MKPFAIALALLVSGWPLAAAAAGALKYYAVLPLLARPRHLAVAIAVLLVTLPLLPWQLYLTGGLGVPLHLATAWNGSATRVMRDPNTETVSAAQKRRKPGWRQRPSILRLRCELIPARRVISTPVGTLLPEENGSFGR